LSAIVIASIWSVRHVDHWWRSSSLSNAANNSILHCPRKAAIEVQDSGSSNRNTFGLRTIARADGDALALAARHGPSAALQIRFPTCRICGGLHRLSDRVALGTRSQAQGERHVLRTVMCDIAHTTETPSPARRSAGPTR